MNPIILFGLNIDLPININNTVCTYSYFLMGPRMHSTTPRFRLDEICKVNGNSRLVETTGGYAIFQTDHLPGNGARVLLCVSGRLQFAVVMGQSLITEEGECIEGDILKDVVVMGVVTFFINGATAFTDENPVI